MTSAGIPSAAASLSGRNPITFSSPTTNSGVPKSPVAINSFTAPASFVTLCSTKVTPRAVNLPSYHDIGEHELDRVANVVRSLLQ